ncbi:hypothetical protein [Actinomadura sp. RB99]|uniref:hypothetical protein n=1 Tax=Actinomadura sp. RB99 TaxID=2691577 RepID=UPI001681D40C|nr:hypothetical protein [Actinomadura sp. RB99]
MRTWFNTAPTAYLVEARAEVRTLLAESGGGSDRLRVRSDGRIAPRATPRPARGSPAGPEVIVPGCSPSGSGRRTTVSPCRGEAPRWLPGMLATQQIGGAVASRCPLVSAD